MDLHNALAALIRPVALPGLQSGVLPFASSLLALNHLEHQMLPLATVPPVDIALTPKKARFDDSPLSSHSSTTVSSTQLSSPCSTSPRRKIPQPIPTEKKDDAYYERRRKNNDAAKRSRDARRYKEDQTARRAQLLEQENAQLRGQLALLKSELTNIQLLMLSARTNSLATNSSLSSLSPQLLMKKEEPSSTEQIEV